MKATALSPLFLLPFVLAGCPKSAPVPAAAPDAVEEPASEPAHDPNLVRGRQIAAWYAEKNFSAMFDNSTEAMQQALPTEAWPAVHAQFNELLGAEGELLDETTQPVGELIVYQRTAKWDKSGAEMVTHIALTADGKLAGFQLVPVMKLAESRFLDYQTKTDMQLPFTGEWFVFWGGRTLKQNYHAAHTDQRFALDLLIMKDGKSFKTDGKTNEDYYAFSQPVVSPGAGVVTSVENSVPDNVPGEMNPEQPTGNHVIIDHGNEEFSFLAHIKQGTVKVAAGDEVSAGQALGECGNSGNTSEAHIHYHLQTTGEYGRGEGLPIQFQNYTADGEAVERGEVVQGQRISP
jgi:murein DD-endopeptidase MepM/ murein hydrolase activator NlpD